MIIYHNPRCGKSRKAVETLNQPSCEVVEYLKQPLSVDELKFLAAKLGMTPLQFIRTKEPIFQELFAGKKPGDEELYKAIAQHPILLERPIVVKGDKAWIARTDEALEKLKM
jgi:arsenate reductase